MKILFLILCLLTAAQPALFASTPTGSRASDVQTGVASWYGSGFIGGKTANGEIYRREDRTAAHRSLPFGTLIRVSDPKTGRSTVVRVNNRGPFVKGRIVDLSLRAASDIGLTSRGVARVKLEVLPRGFVESNGQARLVLDTWFQPLVAVSGQGLSASRRSPSS